MTTPIKLIGHNGFWFQGVPFRGFPPGGPHDGILGALVRLYLQHDPTVVCLQEIQDVACFEQVKQALGMEGLYVPGKELPVYGGAIFAPPSAKIRLIASSEDCDFPVQRFWMAAEIVTAERTIRVVNVHLPSARQLGPEAGRIRRFEELNSIVASVPQADWITGDFNERTPGLVGSVLEPLGWRDAAILANAGDTSTNLRGSRGDYWWLRSHLQSSLSNYQAIPKEQFTTTENGKDYLSDHLPMVIESKNATAALSRNRPN